MWTALCAVLLCNLAPNWLMLSAMNTAMMTCALSLLALRRGWQGLQVLLYRRNLLRLPRYQLRSGQFPTSTNSLFLGKGFRWKAEHTQRLHDCSLPEVRHWLRPGRLQQMARSLEQQMPVLKPLLSADSLLNPVRPLPSTGGSSLLHGVERREQDVTLPLADRTGHTLVCGSTRVGKTRLAELLIAQDIRRGEVVIIFDPKGDADLLKRAWLEAVRAGRQDTFFLFHLGWPELSARYNAVGRFDRISEVASRIAGQLSTEGNSAAFREFAWRFVNIIARALAALGKRPDYQLIARNVVNIDNLFISYARHTLPRTDRRAWEAVVQIADNISEKNTPRNLQGRDKHVVALEQYLSQSDSYDPILDGLRSAVRYDRTYFDKIVASLLPLLEKLTTGSIAQLLAPDYCDLNDSRPIFDWMQVIRKRGIAYIATDALSDSEVSTAVGNSMFADLVGVAGHIYKFGVYDGLPASDSPRVPINLHCDEFAELMGDEFIPMVNKGGGAGIQVTAYTQVVSDIESRTGSAAKAGQVIGNFNNLIMLRVRETATAELLTRQLPEVEIRSRCVGSGVTDASDPAAPGDFTSHITEQVALTRVPMLHTSALVQLPKGQAFALLEGGQLWKIRLPLPVDDPDIALPESVGAIAQAMQRGYRTGERWWNSAQ